MNTEQRRIIFALCFALSLSPLVPAPGGAGFVAEIFRYFFRDASSTFDPHIKDISKRYGIDDCLVKAIIEAESRFDHVAISPRGAMGLMQLMPLTAREMGVSHPFNPRENIEGGVKYLKYLMKRFDNDMSLTLAAYNAGPEVVKRYGGIPPYKETKEYMRKVMESYSHYRTLQGAAGDSAR